MNGRAGDAKGRILGRVRDALEGRRAAEHPGSFEGWRPDPQGDPIDGFESMFTAAGGEVVHTASRAEAEEWLTDFAAAFDSVALGEGVPEGMVRRIVGDPPTGCRVTDPTVAQLGISMARGAIAETGSLMLDARDGRRAQLLTPTHVVIVHAATVHAFLRDALASVAADLPSAIGFHSGPSKSADIGQVMVKGVHGPGRVVALIVRKGDN